MKKVKLAKKAKPVIKSKTSKKIIAKVAGPLAKKVIKDDSAKVMAKQIAKIASDHKAVDISVLELTNLSSFTDYFVICSGMSDRQVTAIADAIHHDMKQRGRTPISEEGKLGGKWALIDYGEVVAHIFYHEEREHYQLEEMWRDAPRLRVE